MSNDKYNLAGFVFLILGIVFAIVGWRIGWSYLMIAGIIVAIALGVIPLLIIFASSYRDDSSGL